MPLALEVTPAYAGKSRGFFRLHPTGRNHPRVCGEKPPAGDGLNLILGSPPRVRGKEGQEQVSGRAVGITPACAGKSDTLLDLPPGQRDHPRVCGEKHTNYSDGSGQQGSPPRVRGKDAGCLVHHEKHRITPAYAGKRLLPRM